MIGFLYEKLTGKPWITVRSMAAEFGPPPAVEFEYEFRRLRNDHLLILRGDEVVAEARAMRNARVRLAAVPSWKEAA